MLIKRFIFLMILFVLVFSKNTFAQYLNIIDTSITLKKVTTNEKTFYGKIDNKYDITIYLKFHSISGSSWAVYSVKGFYYYNNIKKKIPLVGIYDYNVGLTLYYFTSKQQEDTLLDFKLSSSDISFWDELDLYQNMQNFSEKFILKTNEPGEWKKGAKTLNVTLTNNQLDFYTTLEYLHINKNNTLKTIDLEEIGITERNFELINYAINSNQTKVLLKYNYSSSSYSQGMCGAGEETGYIILYFDAEYKLQNTEDLLIASCLESIEFEETKTNNPNEKKFVLTQYQSEKVITTTALLNFENISIIKTGQ